MNIVIRELKSNLKSLLIWSGSIIAFMLIAFAEFSAYYQNPEMTKVLEMVPENLLNAFSMTMFDLTTVSGFFGVLYIYFALMLAIFASVLGGNLLSKEEREKTIEFIGVMPVTRMQIVMGKMIAGIINCVVITVLTGSSVFVFTSQYEVINEFSSFVWLCLLAILLIELLFFFVALAISGATKYHHKATQIALTIPTIFYIISVVSGLSDKTEWVGKVSPFKFFNPKKILDSMAISNVNVCICFVVMLISITICLFAYNKRDLES